MLALAGQPSLHGYDACVVHWNKGALLRNRRQKYGKTSFSPCWVFLFSQNSRVRFWGFILWHLGIGRAKHPGPASPFQHFGLEVFNVGAWFRFDFLAVVEHRLIPAGVRSEWGLASVWALAGQGSSHVGHAEVGVISKREAPTTLPSFATAQFKWFFDCGRAVRCMNALTGKRDFGWALVQLAPTCMECYGWSS